MTREEAETIILKHQFAFASMPDDVIEAINYLVKKEPKGLMIAEKFAALQDEYSHLMGKYQMMKADYENQLKNDLVAILTEIQTEIDEVPRYRMTNHGICIYRGMEEYRSDVNNVIKKVIDGLKEESEEEDD